LSNGWLGLAGIGEEVGGEIDVGVDGRRGSVGARQPDGRIFRHIVVDRGELGGCGAVLHVDHSCSLHALGAGVE